MQTSREDPLELLGTWWREAEGHAHVQYAAAACLSTVDASGRPDGRIVLVHRADPGRLLLATDRRSPKSDQLAGCPAAALTFYWGPMDRQVRLRGRVELASPEAAELCFAERPRGSRITAWASHQSRPLSERAELEARYREREGELAGTEPVPRPPHWVAYDFVPDTIELWEAAAFRLHHRRYFVRRSDGSWEESWLDP